MVDSCQKHHGWLGFEQGSDCMLVKGAVRQPASMLALKHKRLRSRLEQEIERLYCTR